MFCGIFIFQFFDKQATVFATAITQIFGGSALEVRTVNSGAGNSGKPASGNRQPFFDLQLDIKVCFVVDG